MTFSQAYFRACDIFFCDTPPLGANFAAKVSHERVFALDARKLRLEIQEPLNAPFLMGCFPGDFQEGKRPIKAFGETAH